MGLDLQNWDLRTTFWNKPSGHRKVGNLSVNHEPAGLCAKNSGVRCNGGRRDNWTLPGFLDFAGLPLLKHSVLCDRKYVLNLSFVFYQQIKFLCFKSRE